MDRSPMIYSGDESKGQNLSGGGGGHFLAAETSETMSSMIYI